MTRAPESWRGRSVAVWGAARSGVAAANLLVELGASVVLSDARPIESLALDGLDPRVHVRGGGNVLAGATYLVPSPGIKPTTPALRAALDAGVQLVAEVEFAASVARAPIIAITGTDGKSTTTEMVGAVARAAGVPTVVAGNIGDPLSARALDVDETGVVVAEISEFQLWSCGYFRPRVAVVTNVAEDHTDYFDGDRQGCTRAMARLVADQRTGDTAILRADDPVVTTFGLPEGVARVEFGPTRQVSGWGLSDGVITRAGEPVMRADALSLPGRHNVANAQAALAVAEAMGWGLPAAIAALGVFRGLPHRLERFASAGGVDWYDDSKATNPHAAARGLEALDRALVIITGGYDKGLDLTPLVEAAAPRARHVIAVGPTAVRTVAALAGRCPVERAEDLESATRRAHHLARRGDAIVLSPAASSFDRFSSYAERGERFQAFARALLAEDAAGEE